MKNLVQMILMVANSISIIMVLISVFFYLKKKTYRTKLMLFFWSAYLLYFVHSYLVAGMSDSIIATATYFWILRLIACQKIIENITRTSLKKRWHTYVLAAGTFLTSIFILIQASFVLMTLPIAMAISIVGVEITLHGFKALQGRKNYEPHFMLLIVFVVIFIHPLDYPFARMNPVLSFYGYSLVFLTTFLVAILVPTILFAEQEKEYSEKLEELVDHRSLQLVNQSKLSALGVMASGVAHEINNPLCVISLKLSQLLRQFQKLEMKGVILDIELMNKMTDRISEIIRGLRDFSQDTEKLPMVPVPLRDIVNGALDLCRGRIINEGVKFSLPTIPDVEILCQKVQIAQAILNILDNALDALEETSTKWIDVKVDIHHDCVRLRITDGGKGIPEEIKDKIMEPFFTTKNVGKGTGLGLSIALGIVEKHQGKLYLDRSAPNTSFVIELPVLSGDELS